jgi:hypothetical protein
VYGFKIRTRFYSGQMGKTSTVACDRRQMTDGENLGPHLRDDHRVDQSPLAKTIFVHHFVQVAGGTAGAH